MSNMVILGTRGIVKFSLSVSRGGYGVFKGGLVFWFVYEGFV